LCNARSIPSASLLRSIQSRNLHTGRTVFPLCLVSPQSIGDSCSCGTFRLTFLDCGQEMSTSGYSGRNKESQNRSRKGRRRKQGHHKRRLRGLRALRPGPGHLCRLRSRGAIYIHIERSWSRLAESPVSPKSTEKRW
jgi:hypothetical protein